MSTLSLIDLPPEVRSLIYDFLLCDAVSDNDRMIYYGRKMASTDQIFFTLSQTKKFIGLRGIPQPQAWLVNISDLLNLAASCRQLRSELLVFAWSRADIHINARDNELETLMKYAECIFDEHRAKFCCNFIRTLHISILESTWEPHHTRAIVGIIHRLLPRLEKLTLQVGYVCSGLGSGRPQKALCALGMLKPHIAVKLRANFFRPFFGRPGQHPSQVRANQQKRASADAADLAASRSKGQKRRIVKMEREEKDELLDILQDTIDLRCLALR